MRHLAVFYHARIEGGSPAINPRYGRELFTEQMDRFVASGLYANSHECIIGLNGTGGDFVRDAMPPGCALIEHGNVESLLPTYLVMEQFAKDHPDWYICFWHTKGVTHAYDSFNIAWRRCMEKAVIEKWQLCVLELDKGCDSAGAHWLTREQYGPCVETFFWGGAFFWVKAEFLNKLPPLPKTVKTRDDWFIPENWIGKGPRPIVKDFCPHWPNPVPCSIALP